MVHRRLSFALLVLSCTIVGCEGGDGRSSTRPFDARESGLVEASAPDANAKDSPCPKGTTYGSPARSTSKPKGACNTEFAQCMFITADPCPGSNITGPHIEWTCYCSNGAIDCDGRPLDKSTCPPVLDAGASQ